jgi:hypothetical protein
MRNEIKLFLFFIRLKDLILQLCFDIQKSFASGSSNVSLSIEITYIGLCKIWFFSIMHPRGCGETAMK